jgi:hypothetical protein
MHFLFGLKRRLQEVRSGSASKFVSGIGILIRKRMEMLPEPSWIRKLPAKNNRFDSLFYIFLKGKMLAILFTSLGPHERSLAPRSPPTTSPRLPTRKDLENLTSCLGQIRHFCTSGAGQQRCLRLPQMNNLLFNLRKV